MRLGTYYRTVGHTRWSQLLWRACYLLERRRPLRQRAVSRWRWSANRPPRVREDFPSLPLIHDAKIEAPGTPIEPKRGEFRILNQTLLVGHERPDWRLGAISANRLETITLHYHAWAWGLAQEATQGANADEAAALFRHYVSDWMTHCALEVPGARALAWNAYAIATRLIWWIHAYRLLGADRWRSWGNYHGDFLACLWQQAAYLRDHLEWDLRANHLMRDAVGLAWAGRFFDEDQAREWLSTATYLAVEQIAEQVLPDGAHFERSPMYHLHVMEDTLSLVLLLEDPQARKQLRDAWSRMAEFLAWLRHPDGDLALFNDGALQGPDAVTRMLHLGEHLGVEISAAERRGGRHFPQAGLAVWQGDPWTLFFDVGAVGPDYQPGHAHADTLAVECSFQGQRLFVDPGTYAYDLDERRRYDRSTAAHNTVGIDGQDSSEVWHIFRVGRRAYPREVAVSFSAGGMQASASHTGYDHLPGRPRHTRRIDLGADGKLLVTDHVEGRGRHLVNGGFLLAPEWTAAAAADGWLLTSGERRVRLTMRVPEGAKLYEEHRAYHPEYGREIDCTRLSWRLEGGLPVEVVALAEGA
jgi:uncharacterized heparinase superfamily protein